MPGITMHMCSIACFRPLHVVIRSDKIMARSTLWKIVACRAISSSAFG